MPNPRPRRAARAPDDEAPGDPAQHARLIDYLRNRLFRNAWLKACRREMWRRVVAAGPPNGPWAAEPGLTEAISHEYIAQGAIPPPGMAQGMYPEGWVRKQRQ